MTCSRCGSWQDETNLGNKFCSNCGGALAAPAPFEHPTVVAPVYAAPEYADPVPGLVHEPYGAPQRPARPPAPERDWLRHPGTWVVAATALLVAGIVLAAVIVSSGNSGNGNQAAAPASTSASASAAAVVATPSAAPSTQTQTVVVVPAAPGTPAETRTVTVAPEQPTGVGSSAFGGATEVDSAYYERGSTVYFDSPSHNIGCRLVSGGAQAQCTIKDYDFSEPGYDCDQGAGVLQNASEAPVIDCIHNPAYDGESTLEYGESVTYGGFSCVSRVSGITCLDAYSNGFTLSREDYTEY